MDDRDGIDPKTGKAFRVLICDDNEPEAHALKQLLLTHGYIVPATPVDGRELVTWLRKNPGEADLVLLDIIMPRLDGFAAFWEIKQLKPFPRIVFMSAENSSAVIRHVLENGAYDYVTKPINRVKLLDRVKVAVRRPPPA